MEARTLIAYALILLVAFALAGGWLGLTRFGRAERRLERLAERARKRRRKERQVEENAIGSR